MSKLVILTAKILGAAALLLPFELLKDSCAQDEEGSEHHAFLSPAALKEPVDALIAGNKRFVEGRPVHPLDDAKRRKELVSGQTPKAAVLSCSDSRVPPELIFDQGLGEIFAVRTAGEAADQVALGSIEYAVEHLGTKLVLVLGHESCGAIKATLSAGKAASSGSDNLDHLVGLIRPNVQNFQLSADDKLLIEPVKANVEGMAQSLLQRSKILKEKVEAKELLIVKGLYHLESGRVDIWF